MKLSDIKLKPVLLEGGNVTINDQSADRIDTNAREQAVPLIDNALAAINAAYAQFSGQPLWHPELLKSRQFLSGSAFHFFDRANIRDLDFHAAKPTVGDIDTQVDMEMREDITKWLQQLPVGSRLGEAVYLGVKDDPLALAGAQLITLWTFPALQIKTKNPDGTTTVRGTNIQIDLELKEFEQLPKTQYRQPTRWSKFSASSSWQDIQSGVKGVFHKYLIMALSKLTEQTVIIRKPVFNRKTKQYDSYKYSEPTQASMYTFAVGSREGGGLRPTLAPVIGSDGRPEEIDGIGVYDAVGTTGYVRDVDQIFANLFGERLKRSDLKKVSQDFDSFTGLLKIIRKYATAEERQIVADKFREKVIGVDDRNRRAQELYKGDAEKDRTEKLTAYNLLNKSLGTTPPPGFSEMVSDYYAKYDKGSVGEGITEAVDYKRKGIKHISAPGTTVEMSDSDFIEFCRQIAKDGGRLDDAVVHLKVDGAGIRFGRTESGEPFMMTSKVTEPMTARNIGAFERYAKNNEAAPERIEMARHYDQALSHIINSDWIKKLPKDTIVQAEMLYTPMGEKTDGGVKFVSIPYDAKALGKKITLVPFLFRVYSSGEVHPQSRQIKDLLLKSSDAETKFVNSELESRGLDVSKIIEPVIKLDPKLVAAVQPRTRDSAERQQARAILTTAREQLSKAIYTSEKIKGRDQLGKTIEGLVVNLPNGMMAKVTSPEMKSAVAAKQAVKPAGQAQPSKRTKTAVVTIGSFVGHRGHQKLVDQVLATAQQVGGDPYIYISPMVGPDDPIPADVKLATWRRLYPDIANRFQVWQPGGSPVKKIEKELVLPPNSPYKHIIVIVGSDRFDTFRSWIATLAKRMQDPRFPGSHKDVTFDVQQIARGEAEGGNGWSFTKLRQALSNPDYSQEQKLAVWMRGFDGVTLGEAWVKKLMQITAQGMGLPAVQEDAVEERFQLPGRLGTKRDRFKSLKREGSMQSAASEPTGPKFTGYFKGRDKPPVGRKLVGGESINPGDRIRTRGLVSNGIVESIEYYRPFGEMAVYYKDGDKLMRTPLSNVLKIPQGD